MIKLLHELELFREDSVYLTKDELEEVIQELEDEIYYYKRMLRNKSI